MLINYHERKYLMNDGFYSVAGKHKISNYSCYLFGNIRGYNRNVGTTSISLYNNAFYLKTKGILVPTQRLTFLWTINHAYINARPEINVLTFYILLTCIM
jgi:hypothetical protein